MQNSIGRLTPTASTHIYTAIHNHPEPPRTRTSVLLWCSSPTRPLATFAPLSRISMDGGYNSVIKSTCRPVVFTLAPPSPHLSPSSFSLPSPIIYSTSKSNCLAPPSASLIVISQPPRLPKSTQSVLTSKPHIHPPAHHPSIHPSTLRSPHLRDPVVSWTAHYYCHYSTRRICMPDNSCTAATIQS